MSRSRALVLVAAVLVCVAGLAAVRSQLVADDVRHADARPPWVERAERAWPGWAATRVGAGRPGSALRAATGDLSPNDWGVPPTFGWTLTFRADRPAAPRQLRRTFRSACAFPPVRAQDVPLVARLVTPGTGAVVATEVRTHCDRPWRLLAQWLGHLGEHPLPPQVRNATVTVVAEPPVELVVFAFVRASDATRVTAAGIKDTYCAFPGRRRVSLDLRSLGGPRAAVARRRWAVDEPLLALRPVDPQSCAASR